MSDLRIVSVGDGGSDVDEVRVRSGRNRLEVEYLHDTLVECSTVRPSAGDGAPAVATIIARVLPGFRRRGFGSEMYVRELALARELPEGVDIPDGRFGSVVRGARGACSRTTGNYGELRGTTVNYGEFPPYNEFLQSWGNVMCPASRSS